MTGKIPHQGPAAVIGKEPIHLPAQDGSLGEFPRLGQPCQLRVRQGGPEKIRKPRGQLIGRERPRRRRTGLRLDQIEEMRGRQHRGEGHLDGFDKSRFAGAELLEQRELALHFPSLHRPTVGPGHESCQHFGGIGHFILVSLRRVKEDLLVTGRRPTGIEWSFQLDPVNQELRPGKAVLALHPEIFQHGGNVIGIAEPESGLFRIEMGPHFINDGLVLRSIDIHFADHKGRAAKMLGELHPGRAVVVHPVGGKVLQAPLPFLVVILSAGRVFGRLLITPFRQDNPRRLHHRPAVRHPASCPEAHHILTFLRNAEIPEPYLLVPRIPLNHRKSVFRRVVPIIEQDVLTITRHAEAVGPQRIFLRLKAPSHHGGPGTVHEGPVENLPGGGVIQLHLQRRHRERLADIVKPTGRRVFRKRFRSPEIHPHEVPDGIVIFRPVHAAQHHAARSLAQLRLRQPRLQPRREPTRRNGVRRRLLLRRHLVAIDRIHHFLPFFRRQRITEIGRQRVEPQLPFLFVRTVAFHTVLLEKGLDRPPKSRRIRQGPRFRRHRSSLQTGKNHHGQKESVKHGGATK